MRGRAGEPSERSDLGGLRSEDPCEAFRGLPVREGAGRPSERGDLRGSEDGGHP